MFSMCSELTPRAHIPDTRIPQLMQPCIVTGVYYKAKEMVLPSSGIVTRQQVIVKSVQSRQRGGPQCPVMAQQAQGGTVGGVDQQQATLTPRHNATNKKHWHLQQDHKATSINTTSINLATKVQYYMTPLSLLSIRQQKVNSTVSIHLLMNLMHGDGLS